MDGPLEKLYHLLSLYLFMTTHISITLNLSIFLQILFKLVMSIDIGDGWLGIVDGQNWLTLALDVINKGGVLGE